MRLTAWLPLAISALALCGAATRPHYGGTLRVEMRAGQPDSGPLRALVSETLARLNAVGTPQPWLALSWQHDPAEKRWQFSLRPGVRLHDGSALTPAAVAATLEAALPDVTIASTAVGDNAGVSVRAGDPMPALLLDLAGNGWLDTGPFRVAGFESGRHATFAANQDYWGGRPFLDAIDVQFGRSLRDQLADLELGKADVVEIGPTDLRRAADRGLAVWHSAGVNLIALEFTAGHANDARLREALALSIDRGAMHSVLLQKQGEVSAALLPQWLSGYAFAFPSAPDLARARALVAALPPAARTATLSYDPAMRAARSLAERIAVNARDAGLAVQASPQNAQADVRLVEARVASLDPEQALAGLAAALGLPSPTPATSAAGLYESERKLLDDFRVIPLFHLPVYYGVSGKVRVFTGPPVTRLGDWDFGGVWLAVTPP